MLSILANFEPIILTLHVVICLFLIVVILLQAGKGADMGAAFGAGSSQSLFGARGAATFLQKMTTAAALFFLMTSISLTAINKNRSTSGGMGDSVVDTQPVKSTAPAAPEAVPTTDAPKQEEVAPKEEKR